MKLSDYVFQFLSKKGVKHASMIAGGGAMHLNDSLGRCKEIQYTCFTHEQALAIATEAYGQYTNRPGVAVVTSGPGGTNTITAVAAAFIDSTPCVFISGQAKRADLKGTTGVRQKGSQEVDIVSMVSCITKYAVTVLDPMDIRYCLEKAWHLATSGRMGPVWLDIPLDVQGAQIEEGDLRAFTPEKSSVAFPPQLTESMSRLIELLNSAERPVILAGNGVKLADAEELFRGFIEENEIPVLLTWKAIDFLGYEHPLNFGSPGILGSRSANFIVQNSDLLVVLGSRLDPSLTAFNVAAFGKNAKKAVVDIDRAEIEKLSPVEFVFEVDAKVFLHELVARRSEIKKRDKSAWLDYCRRMKNRYPVMLDEYRQSSDGINLYFFTDLLFQNLIPTDIITPESSGAAGEVTYQAMRVKKGQKIKNAAGLGAMGFGLPYSIGACIANERRRTILINGDGGFQLNIQELETVRRLGLPIKMFILDNNGYASIRNSQRNLFNGFLVGSDPSSGFTVPDARAIASAYGIRCESASSHEELKGAIDRTLAGNDPALCNVKISEKQVTAPRVQSMKTPEGSMISKPLEDMWPYLPAEEIAENMIALKNELRK